MPTFVNEAVTRADFVRRHPRALGLYLLNGALFLALALGYALFQRALAHASYTAAPPVVCPESPAAESIGNAAV